MESIIEASRKKEILIFIGTLGFIFILSPLVAYKKPLPKKRDDKKEVIRTQAEIPPVALLAHGAIAKRFVHKVSLPIKGESTPEYIIYGNKDFGYFKSKDFTLNSSLLELSLVPPTFKQSVDICVKYKNQSPIWLLEKKFKNPKPLALKNIRLEQSGNFTNNFFLIAAQFVPDERLADGRAFIPIIANKLGEVVWAHMPQNGKTSFKKYPVIKPLGNGEYGILFGEKYSYFERFDFNGDIKEFVFPKTAADPYIVHHDFAYLGNSKILTLGHKLHYVRNWFGLQKTFLPSVLTLLKPTSFLSTTVEVIDLKTNTNTVIWDPIEHFNPLDPKTPWARTDKELRLNLAGEPRHFYKWSERRAQVDWTHANTVEYYPGVGILVSLRNLSKVLLLDEKTHKVLWTIGNDPSDSFQTLNELHSFYHQHHVQILPDGHIIMMDNHSAPPAPKTLGSRVLIYGLNSKNNRAQVVWNYQPSKRVRIGNRGSAYALKNQNVIAFYPASLGLMDHIVEVDYKTGQPIAHMKAFFTDVRRNFSDKQLEEIKKSGLKPITKIREGGGNRAVPLNTIGLEERVENDVICSR